MAFPPRLLIIGAQKAGTTTLAALLARHPDIALGTLKEPDFYTRRWSRGLDWYRANYPEPDVPWLIDASPSYTGGHADPETGDPMPVAARIAETVTEPRFIFVMRDPVARAWSAYWHEVRFGDETRAPEDALAPDTGYIRLGIYADRLAEFIERFSTTHLLPLRFETVTGDQQATMDSVSDFLGIPPMTVESRPLAKNVGFQYSPSVRALRAVFPSERAFKGFVTGVKKVLPAPLRFWTKRLATQEIPPMPPDLGTRLAEIFEPHTQRLEQQLNMTFDQWTRP